jgi:hypothetical protein
MVNKDKLKPINCYQPNIRKQKLHCTWQQIEGNSNVRLNLGKARRSTAISKLVKKVICTGPKRGSKKIRFHILLPSNNLK